MFNWLAVIILTGFVLTGCNEHGKYYDTNRRDTSKRVVYKADSLAAGLQPAETVFNQNDLQPFCNNEITGYCVLLPLNEFKEDFTNSSGVKAQHKFLLKQDSTSFTSIEVQAYSIDKKNNYNTALFYNRDKKDIAEGGLGMDTAFINLENHLYLIKGYLPNYMNMKFIQLNWILKDRIAVYINYDEKDEVLWKYRIAAIIKRGVTFSDR
jgi:hypothetical protein